MHKEVLEISYESDKGNGIICLNCLSNDFSTTLSIIEQHLADAQVTNIVYTWRNRNEDEFLQDQPFEEKQCSLFDLVDR